MRQICVKRHILQQEVSVTSRWVNIHDIIVNNLQCPHLNKSHKTKGMSKLNKVITDIKNGIDTNASYISTIRHPILLIKALKELEGLIGNRNLKESIADEINNLIVTKKRNNNRYKSDNIMMNTLVYGPPGVGKSLIGVKLAKIWYALGYLRGNPKREAGAIAGALNDAGVDLQADTATIVLACASLFLILVMIVSAAKSFYDKLGFELFAGLTVLFVLFVCAIIIFSSYSNETPDYSNTNVPANKQPEEIIQQNDNTSTMQQYFPPDHEIVSVISREDLVEKYVGWTAKGVREMLMSNLGKVLFVDEAYTLANGGESGGDTFGKEVLDTMNKFMSEHPNDIIIIFAGYESKMKNGPFKLQPGLERRFTWKFNCEGYNYKELFEIFKLKLKADGMRYDKNRENEILALFRENEKAFGNYGGDVERVLYFSKLAHSSDYMGDETRFDINTLDSSHIEVGIGKLRENTLHHGRVDNIDNGNILEQFMERMKREEVA